MSRGLVSRRRLLVLAGAGLALAPVPAAVAHRAKAVLTLVRWNRAEGVLEIDHALHAHDGELALNQVEKVGTPDLSQVQDQARLALYTEARFALIPQGRAPLTLKTIGAELMRDYLHVYQEAPLTAVPSRMTVRDGILRDVFRTQANQVNFDMADGDPTRIRTLTFSGNDGDKEVLFDN